MFCIGWVCGRAAWIPCRKTASPAAALKGAPSFQLTVAAERWTQSGLSLSYVGRATTETHQHISFTAMSRSLSG